MRDGRRLQIAPAPMVEPLRLADVEHASLGVFHEIDPGPRWKSVDGFPEAWRGQGRRSPLHARARPRSNGCCGATIEAITQTMGPQPLCVLTVPEGAG